ncbi:hypothetical protein PV08_01068 [Exophiala spinifera]|uniref:Uncharacterized protein n=1 Tax=Exophiala spinifera TaxID=91928 RepID=A0A0D2BNM2_9EURO|nr:uncharacterized protein PV08_01068 [Exophiala spinifera]KIW20493.1 hypothetical protein PV08_01068 [Exophiala spinifera]
MDRIAQIIHRRMLERQRAKEARQWKLPPPLSPQIPQIPTPGDSLPTENQGRPALLDLPFEIRRIILRHLLSMEEVRTVTRRPIADFFQHSLHDVKYDMETAILRTCKQLSWEGKVVLCENNFVAVPNFRLRAGRVPMWKLPQSLSSKIKPVLTVKSTDFREKLGSDSLISILDFRHYCDSLLLTADVYGSSEFSFRLELNLGLAQKLWGFPDERSFLDYMSTCIISIGPRVKNVRMGDFDLSCSRNVSGTHPRPPELTNLEQKVWDILREGRLPTSSQRVRAAFKEAERLFENQHLSQAREQYLLVKDMIISTQVDSLPRYVDDRAKFLADDPAISWCLFRVATIKTDLERRGFDSTCDHTELIEARSLTELARKWSSPEPPPSAEWLEYSVRLWFREAELFAMQIPPPFESDVIKRLCQVVLFLIPAHVRTMSRKDWMSWVHVSVHGDDASNWLPWDPSEHMYDRFNYRIGGAESLEGKFDRARDLISRKYGDEATWEHYKAIWRALILSRI